MSIISITPPTADIPKPAIPPPIAPGNPPANAPVVAPDIADNNKLRADARSSQFDMFNYHLGNVKALPNTLTKVSTYNINNKIYPFYEIYEATSEEIEALRQQLKWRGYNLGIIGQLSDFQVEGKYFKGKLIRLEEVQDVSLGDSHLIENFNSELQQGVYWTKL